MERSRTHIGDLSGIIQAVKGSRLEAQLATPSPQSLLSQLAGVCSQEKEEKEELVLGEHQNQSRRLIEEIPVGGARKKEAGFAANLRKAFCPGRKVEEEKKEEDVKIRHSETFLREVETRRIK